VKVFFEEEVKVKIIIVANKRNNLINNLLLDNNSFSREGLSSVSQREQRYVYSLAATWTEIRKVTLHNLACLHNTAPC